MTSVTRPWPTSMTLRELFGAAAAGRPPTSRSPRSPTTTAGSRPAPSSSACAASPATATTSPPTPSRAARSRSSSTTRSASACRRSSSTDVRAAMAPAAARLHGDPTATLRTIGVTGTNGKTTSAYLVRALLEAAGEPTGLLGTVTSIVGGSRARGRAHDARGDRPAGDVRRDARRRRHALRHGGLQPRARARPRRRDPLGGGDLHEPHAGPPRLPSRRWRTTSPPNAGSFATGGRRSRSSTSTIRTARGWRPSCARRATGRAARHGRDRLAPTPTCARPTSRAASPARRSRAGGLELRSPLPGRFNVMNVLGAVAAVRALGVDDATIVAALPEAGRVPGPLRARRRGPGLRRPRRLRAHARLAGERADRGAAADRRAGCCASSAAAATATAASARRWARSPPAWPTTRSSRRTTRARRTRRRSSTRSSPGSRIRRRRRRRGDRRPPRRDRARGRARRRRATSSSIAGKGHEQGQEFEGGRKLPFDDVSVAREALRARLVA